MIALLLGSREGVFETNALILTGIFYPFDTAEHKAHALAFAVSPANRSFGAKHS
jgi:hypothetical protein